MSLQVEMDSYDYDQAIKVVQKLLNAIDIECDNPDSKTELKDVPDATEIVDLVWDIIK